MCGRAGFPAAQSCGLCGSVDVRLRSWRGTGRVESRTKIGDRWIVEIKIDDGPRVMGWITASQLVQVGEWVDEDEMRGTLAFKVIHER